MTKKILTVDDALTMRKMISLTLRGAGYDIVEAADGMDALNVVRNQQVDLMIVDVNMPRMNGIEFTKQVRTMAQYRRTPILILTTESATGVKNQGRAAGATGWIVKPFKQDQLITVVNKVFSTLVTA